MPKPLIQTRGPREFIRAADAAGRDTKKVVRDRLRKVGDIVREDAQARFDQVDGGRRHKFGVSVRRSGEVAVEERLRRTTGNRPDFGALQMRKGLIPAGDAKTREAEAEMERALDELADKF